MQEVIAAITTSPSDRVKSRPSTAAVLTGFGTDPPPSAAMSAARVGAIDAANVGERGFKRRIGNIQRHPVLRPPWTGERGNHIVKVERQGVGEDRIGGAVAAEHALGTGVGFDQGDLITIAAGCPHIGERVRRRPGKKPQVAPYSGDMLAMVA